MRVQFRISYTRAASVSGMCDACIDLRSWKTSPVLFLVVAVLNRVKNKQGFIHYVIRKTGNTIRIDTICHSFGRAA